MSADSDYDNDYENEFEETEEPFEVWTSTTTLTNDHSNDQNSSHNQSNNQSNSQHNDTDEYPNDDEEPPSCDGMMARLAARLSVDQSNRDQHLTNLAISRAIDQTVNPSFDQSFESYDDENQSDDQDIKQASNDTDYESTEQSDLRDDEELTNETKYPSNPPSPSIKLQATNKTNNQTDKQSIEQSSKPASSQIAKTSSKIASKTSSKPSSNQSTGRSISQSANQSPSVSRPSSQTRTSAVTNQPVKPVVKPKRASINQSSKSSTPSNSLTAIHQREVGWDPAPFIAPLIPKGLPLPSNQLINRPIVQSKQSNSQSNNQSIQSSKPVEREAAWTTSKRKLPPAPNVLLFKPKSSINTHMSQTIMNTRQLRRKTKPVQSNNQSTAHQSDKSHSPRDEESKVEVD